MNLQNFLMCLTFMITITKYLFSKDPNNYILMITFIINDGLTLCVNHAKLGEQTGEC